MKSIIAGSRTIYEDKWISLAVQKSGFEITEVVSGCANGADILGEHWATNNKIPIKSFPADWNKYGKSAGMIRNKQMGDYSDCLIAVWDGISRGTNNMITYMKSIGKPVFVLTIKDNEVKDCIFYNCGKKITIIGSSSLDNYSEIKDGIEKMIDFKKLKIKEIITKYDQKADNLIQRWANENSIKCKYFEAKAETDKARVDRNFAMGAYCECILAIWNGEPKGGIVSTVEWANKNNRNILIYNVKTKTITENKL